MAVEQEFGLDFRGGEGTNTYSLAKIQVAPLVDTVLFLIWFYLIVGQLVMHQKDLTVELAQMSSPLSAQELPAEVVINLRSNGDITVAGQVVAAEQLPRLILAERSKAQEAGQSLRVVLRADRRQQVWAVNDILQKCRQAGLSQVIFRAKESGT